MKKQCMWIIVCALCCAGVLTACKDIINNPTDDNVVKLDPGSDPGLTAGDKEITGLEVGKFYKVVECETFEDKNGNDIVIITTYTTKYVMENGELTEKMEKIAAIPPSAVTGKIIKLNNKNSYKVNAAVPITTIDRKMSYWGNKAPVTSQSIKTAQLNAGEINLPESKDSADRIYAINLGLDVTARYEIMKKIITPKDSLPPLWEEWTESRCSGLYNHSADALGIDPPFYVHLKDKEVGIYMYEKDGMPEWVNGMSHIYAPITKSQTVFLITELSAGKPTGDLKFLRVTVGD